MQQREDYIKENLPAFKNAVTLLVAFAYKPKYQHYNQAMKKIILLCCLLLATFGIALGQVLVTTSTGLLTEPSLSSRRITTLLQGQSVTLNEKTGDFWKVVVGRKTGYVHQSCLSNYTDTVKTEVKEPLMEQPAPVKPPIISNDTVDYNQFGGPVAIGIALGGGGLIGFPVRLYPVRNFALELGVFARGMVATKTFIGLNLNGGLNFYFKDSFNPVKKKVRHDGAFFKIGKTFYDADINEFMFMVGWTRDHFKLGIPDKAFTLELGVGLNTFKYVETTTGSWGYETTTISGNSPMLFWKFGWSIFPVKHK